MRIDSANVDLSPVATAGDVLTCFRLLLGRHPSEAEWPGHSALAGTPLQDLVSAYVNSLEFRQRGLLNAAGHLQIVQLNRFRSYTDGIVGNIPSSAEAALGCDFVLAVPLATIVRTI
jgi:hypothetical protein